jgi:hypothetical protein
MPFFESTESKIVAIQCVIIWTTFLIAIIKFTRHRDENEDFHGAILKNKGQHMAGKASSTSGTPMLNFVTIDEIYEMPLEMLQSVPKEQMEQLPPDKRQLVRRRINDLVQEERAKQNK